MNPSIIWARIQQEFTPPENASLVEWRAYFLNTTLLIVWALGLLSYVIALRLRLIENDLVLDIIFTIAILVVTGITFIRRVPYKLRIAVLLLIIYALAAVLLFSLGLTGSGRVYLYTASILAALFVGLKAGLFSVLFNAAILLFAIWQISQGRLSYNPPQLLDNWIATTTAFIMLNMFTTISVGLLVRALGANLALMQDITGSLEQRVAARMRGLTASAEISRAIAAILDREQLISEVVYKVQSAFGYARVYIYLLDEARQKLVLAGSAGEAGMTMPEQGRFVSLGQGAAGRAAAANKAVLISDAAQEANRLPDTLASGVQCEAAIPAAFGGKVIGILVAQHKAAHSITREDIDLLQPVANQIAITLHNIQLYQDVETQAAREAQVNIIGQKIQQAMDVETTLQIAVQELGRALGAQRTSIQIGVRRAANGRSPAGND